MKYRIAYQHTSAEAVTSRRAALAAVKREALHAVRPPHKGPLWHVEADGGTCLYLSAADAQRDPDGSSAFAVVSPA